MRDRRATRSGSVLLRASDLKRMLLVGPAKGAPFVQAFDPATRTWSEFASAAPAGPRRHPPLLPGGLRPGTKTVYCLSGGPCCYSFSLAEKTWKAHPAGAGTRGPELAHAWPATRRQAARRRRRRQEGRTTSAGPGRSSTTSPSGKWSRLEVADQQVVAEHRELVAAQEAAIDLVGRIRLAWYRDPKGVGTDGGAAGARRALRGAREDAADGRVRGRRRCGRRAAGRREDARRPAGRPRARSARSRRPPRPSIPCPVAAQLAAGLRREEPRLRPLRRRPRGLPDERHLGARPGEEVVAAMPSRTGRPARAPATRSCGLPKSGRVALYEGYVQSRRAPTTAPCPTRRSTRAALALRPEGRPLGPRWAAGRCPPRKTVDRAGAAGPLLRLRERVVLARRRWPPTPTTGSSWPPTPTAVRGTGAWKRPGETWVLAVDPAAGRRRRPREARRARPTSGSTARGPFLAEFCEVPDEPKDTGLDRLARQPLGAAARAAPQPLPRLPPARLGHVRLGLRPRPGAPLGRRPLRALGQHRGPLLAGLRPDRRGLRRRRALRRQRRRRVRLVAARTGPGSRTHNYNHYAYDPKCKLLVSGRGYLYDPERMDWLRMEPIPLPFAFDWGSIVRRDQPRTAPSPGRRKTGSEDCGLWLFDREKGWIDLEPQGQALRALLRLARHGLRLPARPDALQRRRRRLREAEQRHASWPSTSRRGQLDDRHARERRARPRPATPARWPTSSTPTGCSSASCTASGDEKTGKRYTRVYDCAKNKMFLLDAGRVPAGYSAGWMYDARRKLVYVFTYRGEAWAMKIDPATARLVERPEPSPGL